MRNSEPRNSRSIVFSVGIIIIIVLALGWRFVNAKNQKAATDRLQTRFQSMIKEQQSFGKIVRGMISNDPAKVAVAERELTPENLKRWKSNTDWAVHAAAQEGNTQAMNWMLRHGWVPRNANVRQAAWNTAQRFCYTDIVSLFIDYGMDPDGNHNRTPLMSAAARPDLEMAKMLLTRGANLELASKPMPPLSMGGA